MRHIVTVLSLIACASSPLYCQFRDAVIIHKYTQKDGLSSYNIRKILQDKWGFMWMATQDGLSRFDGKKIVNYKKNEIQNRKLCGTDVRELIEDTITNTLWILPAEVGISAINTITGEVVKNISIPGLGDDDWNVSMMKNAEELWIGTSTGVQIFNTIKNDFEKKLPLPDGLKGSVDFLVGSMTMDENGNVWVGYDGYGIVVYNAKSKRIIRKVYLKELFNGNFSSHIRIYNALSLQPRELLFATSHGLRRIHYSEDYQLYINNLPCSALPSLNKESVSYLCKDTNNTLLVAGFNMLYRFNYNLDKYQQMDEIIRMNETEWISSVSSIYKDRIAGRTH